MSQQSETSRGSNKKVYFFAISCLSCDISWRNRSVYDAISGNVKLKSFLRNISIANLAVVSCLKPLYTIMVNAYLNAQQYATRIANELCKIDLMEFFTNIHGQFYPDVDIEFMETFIEMMKHEHKFIVNGKMLCKYGVMTSTQSSDIRKKLIALDLIEGENYLLRDISEQVKKHGGSNKKEYYLTPDGFKLCLIRARRYGNQPVDPVIYANYFLLLEKVFGLYRTYQLLYSEKLLSMKDDKIERLEAKIDEQSTKIDQQTSVINTQSTMITHQSSKIDTLINLATQQGVKIDEQGIQITELNEKFDGMYDFMIGMARFTLPMWNGASVFKTQLDHLLDGKDLAFALKRLKVMYTVAFYRMEDDHANVEIYFCCTNFEDVRKRIVKLYKRHCVDDDVPKIMLKPAAICLISQEINCERSSLSQLIFNAPSKFNFVRKSFELKYETKKHVDVRTNYKAIVENARKKDLQGYQMRRSKVVEDESSLINHNIIDRLTELDSEFYVETLPHCCNFIDYQTVMVQKKKLKLGYKPRTRIGTKKAYRDDLDMKLTPTMYPLYKINEILITDNGVNQIDIMIQDGIISKGNVKSLFRTAKAAAEAEDIKFDESMQEQVDAINEDDLPDTDDEDF